MKQKVVVSAGSQVFEFEGEITELNESYISLKAKHGEIFIERQYLVFIQFLDDEVVQEQKEVPRKADETTRLINKRLKHDPLNEKLKEKLIPPSQLEYDDEFESVEAASEEDMEVMRNVYGSVYGKDHPRTHAISKADNLKQAIKTAMENEDENFAMGSVEYKDPLQTVLGMKNADSKKIRSS